MNADIEKLQGVWNIVSLDLDGQTIPARGAKIAIDGDHFTSTGMGGTYEGTMEVDESRTPKTLNMKFTAGPEQGNTNVGIYELDGDTWRICLATRGTDRPKKFAAKPGTGIALEVLKRADHASSAEDLPAFNFENVHFEPAPELAGEWKMVSGTLSGQKLDKTMLNSGRRVVEGNDMAVFFGPQAYAKAKFTVDRSKTPMSIDYYNTEGANAGKIQHGIYELDSKTLRLCLAAPGQPRPDDFTSTAGDGRTLAVWARGE